MDNPKKKSKSMLYLLLILFAGPMFIASILFNTHQDWFKKRTLNKGHFIVPPKKIDESLIHHANNQAISTHLLTGKWTLLLSNQNHCKTQCQQGLYNLQQIRKATGKNQHRVQTLLLGLANSDEQQRSKQLRSNFTQTQILFTTINGFKSFQGNNAQENEIYIIDPHGNIMMRYSLTTKPKAILSDLKRLLKVSKIA